MDGWVEENLRNAFSSRISTIASMSPKRHGTS
jgi:hypothetical protein